MVPHPNALAGRTHIGGEDSRLKSRRKRSGQAPDPARQVHVATPLRRTGCTKSGDASAFRQGPDWRRQPWARVLGIVVGFLALIRIPFGTALGIYTIWVLLPESSAREYDAMAGVSGGGRVNAARYSV